MNRNILEDEILNIGSLAREASRFVSQLETKKKNEMLCWSAENIFKNKKVILEANEIDIKENKNKLNSATLDD